MTLPGTIPITDQNRYTCVVLIDGQPTGQGIELISLQTKQAFQLISSAELNFKTSSAFKGMETPANIPLTGKTIIIKASKDFDEINLFEGIIIKHIFKSSAQGSRLRVIAKTVSIKLAMHTSPEIFHSQSDSQVIESISEKHGCTVKTSNIITQLKTKHTQLVKYESSDWDFINIRAEENGCYVFTEKNTIHLVKPKENLNPLEQVAIVQSENLYEIELEKDDRKFLIRHEVAGLNLSNLKNEVTKEETGSISTSTLKGLNTSTNYNTFNELENDALVEASAQLKNLSMYTGVVHIKASLETKPGDTLDITGVNEIVNGKYIATSVLHDYSEGGFTTYLQFGLNHQSFRERFCSGQNNNTKMLTGTVSAIEKDPDNLYRIQVKIVSWPHVEESIWARLSSPYAGAEHGIIMVPEIGDEVVLAFLGNEYNTPCIVGAAYSPGKEPHLPFTDDNYQKGMLTKKGMKWIWDDEKMTHEISTPNGNRILISENDHSIIIEDENSNKISLKKQEISLESNMDITIKAKANLKLEALKIDVVASGMHSIQGNPVKIN